MAGEPPSPPLRLDALVALDRACFGDGAWTPAQLDGQLDGETAVNLRAPGEQGLRGAVLGWSAGPTAELLRVMVHPAARRQGLGRALVEAFADAAAQRGAVEVWLEVSSRNDAARALYRTTGFTVSGERPHYYADGSAAVLMTRDLGTHPPTPLAQHLWLV